MTAPELLVPRPLDRSRPYVVELGDIAGMFGEWYAGSFDEMVAIATELKRVYPSKGMRLGNWDCADIDSDGLTDDERELLEELGLR